MRIYSTTKFKMECLYTPKQAGNNQQETGSLPAEIYYSIAKVSGINFLHESYYEMVFYVLLRKKMEESKVG